MYEKQSSQPKVQALNNKYHQQQTLKNIQARRQKYVRQVRKKRLLFIGLIFGVVVLFLGVQIFQTRQNHQTLQAQTQTSQAQLEKVRDSHTDLQQQVRQLNDKTYLEKIIRERYYYSKSGEIIFSLPGDKPSN